MGQVGDVEHGDLHAGDLTGAGGVLAEAHQQAVAERVQVSREAGHLQLPDDPRLTGQVQQVERVGLAEGHDRGDVTEVAHRPDLLALAQAGDPARLDKSAVTLGQLDHHRGRLGDAAW